MNKRTFSFALAVPLAFAQTFVKDPQVSRGFVPTGSYAISDIESIDQTNGNVHLRIPMGQVGPGPAGHSHGVSFVYNSKIFDARFSPYQAPSTAGDMKLWPADEGGWRFAFDYDVEQDYTGCAPESGIDTYKLYAVFPDGSRRYLHPAFTSSQGCVLGPGVGGTFYTVDGSFARLQFDVSGPPQSTPWTLWFPDGSRVRSEPSVRERRIIDRNGNEILIKTTILGDQYKTVISQTVPGNPTPFQQTVELTRYPLLTAGSGQETVSTRGHNGDLLTWTAAYEHKTLPARSYKCNDGAPGTCGWGGGVQAGRFYKTLTLPNNLLYSFTYNAEETGADVGFGELSGITFPTGATVEYSYKYNGEQTASQLPLWYELLRNSLTQKRITHDGVSDVWTYAYEFPENNPSGSTSTITAPGGGKTKATFCADTYKIAGFCAGNAGLVTKLENPDLTVIDRVWTQNHPPGAAGYNGWYNPYVQREIRSLAGSVKAASTLTVQDVNGNTTDLKEWNLGATENRYDPPSSTLLRHKTATMWNTVAYTGARTDCTIATPCNLRVVKKEEVSGFNAASNAEYLVAQRDWTYDDPYRRDNVQTDTAIEFNHPVGSTTTRLTAYTWKPNGNLESSVDSTGASSNFEYGEITCAVPGAGTTVVSGLYRTKQTIALGRPEAQVTEETRDCWTGLVADSKFKGNKVAEDITTKFTYDRYGRQRTVTEAFGTAAQRTTTTDYDDLARITVSKEPLDATREIRSVVRRDELGRVRLSQRFETTAEDESSETAGIKVVTKYLETTTGSFVLTSNPHRATSDPTMGWTMQTLDGAGRVVSTQTYESADQPSPFCATPSPCSSASRTVSTEYLGATTKVTDDATSNVKESEVDAFGRLVKVTEGGESVTYVYDPLNQLQKSTQGVQIRQFTYSSLGNLVETIQPESGRTRYAYDGNGNPTTIEHFGINAAAISSASMIYDKLNRVASKSFSGGNVSPAVGYTYDDATVPYSRGRLTKVENSASLTRYLEYDAVGRVTKHQQRTGGTDFDFGYSYNSLELKAITYPSKRVVSYDYNGNGQVSIVRNGDTGSNYYASSLAYGPHGSLESLRLGDSLYETHVFNRRQQLAEVKLGSAVGSHSVWGLKNLFSGIRDSGAAVGNNGNIVKQELTVNGGTALVHTHYAYDSRDRLTTVTERGTAATDSFACSAGVNWCEKYTYDTYGNRTVAARENTVAPPDEPASIDGATNRINAAGWKYDDTGLGLLVKTPANDSFAFDSEMRMVAHCAGEANPVNCTPVAAAGRTLYRYDGEGKRVRKQTGTVTVTYVYTAFGDLAAEYVEEPSSSNPAVAGVQYLTQDQIGTVRVVTSSTGAVLERRDHRPFGERINVTGSDLRNGVLGYGSPTTELDFAGARRDGESNLQFMEARYYSGRGGRFGSADEPILDQDPADAGSWNRYAYVRGNPLSNTDPSGGICLGKKNGGAGFEVDNTVPGANCDPNADLAPTSPSVTVLDFFAPLFAAVSMKGMGHHPLEQNFVKQFQGTRFFDFFKNWSTGPGLQTGKGGAHSGYGKPAINQGKLARKLVERFMRAQGVNPGTASDKQIAEYARRLLNSKLPDIRSYLDALEKEAPGQLKRLADLIDKWSKTGRIPGLFFIMVDPNISCIAYGTCPSRFNHPNSARTRPDPGSPRPGRKTDRERERAE